MANKLQNRLIRYQPTLIDNNLEYDYLSKKTIDFSAFPTQESIYTVTSYTVGKISLISFEVYENVNFWWLLAIRNEIINPLSELYVGRQIFVPSLIDYYDFYNKNISVSDEFDDLIFAKRKIEIV